jgi:hypothetical protein
MAASLQIRSPVDGDTVIIGPPGSTNPGFFVAFGTSKGTAKVHGFLIVGTTIVVGEVLAPGPNWSLLFRGVPEGFPATLVVFQARTSGLVWKFSFGLTLNRGTSEEANMEFRAFLDLPIYIQYPRNPPNRAVPPTFTAYGTTIVDSAVSGLVAADGTTPTLTGGTAQSSGPSGTGSSGNFIWTIAMTGPAGSTNQTLWVFNQADPQSSDKSEHLTFTLS